MLLWTAKSIFSECTTIPNILKIVMASFNHNSYPLLPYFQPKQYLSCIFFSFKRQSKPFKSGVYLMQSWTACTWIDKWKTRYWWFSLCREQDLPIIFGREFLWQISAKWEGQFSSLILKCLKILGRKTQACWKYWYFMYRSFISWYLMANSETILVSRQIDLCLE